jgi:UDP-N-acetylmuramoyl-tripeptide--D-alanyl-D-alanine ligase
MATPIPQNRASFTLAAILRETRGELASGGALASDTTFTGVSTDSRALAEGAVFVALTGEIHDGHDHLPAAAKAGARLALVERDCPQIQGLALLRVPSTLSALGDLARAHARAWRALGGPRTLVAITGSAGKTTTRVALAALLEHLHPGAVHGAAGNLNNRIGVPMVLFGLGPEHHLGLIEMGMNQPGEIAELCRIVEPEIGIVTLIAAAHTERVGSIEGVAHEKGALFRALPASGVAIANADDPRVRAQLASSPASRRVLYGRAPDAQIRILARELDGLTRSRLRIAHGAHGAHGAPSDAPADLSFATPLLGEAGALASAAAIAALEIGLGEALDSATCAAAFAKADVGAGAGRLVPRLLPSGLALIDDSYNGNPASTCASIRAAAEIARATGRRLLLVLGEMLELGAESARGHDEVGHAVVKSGAAQVIAVRGQAVRIAARAAEGGVVGTYVDTSLDAAALLRPLVRPTDLVLVKGSRGVGTERVIQALIDSDEARAPRGAQA